MVTCKWLPSEGQDNYIAKIQDNKYQMPSNFRLKTQHKLSRGLVNI